MVPLSLVTDISPMLGLMLVGMVDATLIVAAAILVSAAITGYYSAKSIKKMQAQMKQTKTAMEQQVKINSALMLLKMDKVMRAKRFKEVWDYIYDEGKEPDEVTLERYLNNLNTFANLQKEEVITKGHMMEAYRNLIVFLWENSHVIEFVARKREQYGTELYRSLERLYKEYRANNIS